jgi:predicted acetyltransferase
MDLVAPSFATLDSYVAALGRGWSPNSERGLAAAREELAQIEDGPQRFLDSLGDLQGTGELELPDGSRVPRLPGFRRWMWDGAFCGSIGLRWQPGTADLPPYCLGHIGYSVVPWKQRQGHATRALALLLPQARELGLPHVEVTADAHNTASHKVILANGGVLLREEDKPAAYGGGRLRRFRITLTE